jgi:hypothetical protein
MEAPETSRHLADSTQVLEKEPLPKKTARIIRDPAQHLLHGLSFFPFRAVLRRGLRVLRG